MFVRSLLLGAVLLWGYQPHAVAGFGEEEINDCLLTYLLDAKLDDVSRLVRRVCRETYRQPNFLSKRERAHNFCLLDKLQGVESPLAAATIIDACYRRHQRFGL